MRALSRPVVALLLAALLVSACTVNRSDRLPPERPDGRASSICLLMCDGLSDEALNALLAEGHLPTIKSLIMDRGLRVQTAVASLPSETYPNVATMMTGLLPGHNGIAANIWVDRSLRRTERHTNLFRIYSTGDFLATGVRTIFERLPGPTIAITTPVFKGATEVSKNTPAVVASYFRNDWAFLDRKTLEDAGDAYRRNLDEGRIPSLVWAHILGPDEVAHYDGPDSQEFADLANSLDRSFARLVRRLNRWKILDRVLFVLVGDHGNESYTRALDSDELVFRVLYSHPTEAYCLDGGCYVIPFTKSKKRAFDIGDTKIAVGAYRGLMIWLPGERPQDPLPVAFKKGRRKKRKAIRPIAPPPPRSEFAAALSRLPEIALVISRAPIPGNVEIYGPNGRGLVQRDDSGDEARYLYLVTEGQDPLGYTSRTESANLIGRPSLASEWLIASRDTEYPDLVVQLAEYFDSPRAPDVYITPVAGVGFRAARASGHGALLRKEMVVPLVFAGPGVFPGKRLVARTADLAPTLLSYFGIPYDETEMDGEDLKIVSPVPPGGRRPSLPAIPVPDGEDEP
jgi:arylsulfatase A-like enzyme